MNAVVYVDVSVVVIVTGGRVVVELDIVVTVDVAVAVVG